MGVTFDTSFWVEAERRESEISQLERISGAQNRSIDYSKIIFGGFSIAPNIA